MLEAFKASYKKKSLQNATIFKQKKTNQSCTNKKYKFLFRAKSIA